MGMGFASCQVLTVEEDFIKEQCPGEFQALIDSFDPYEEDNSEFNGIDDFARIIGNGEIDPKDKPGNSELKYIALQKSFEQKTGLEITLFYHDPEDGDRYDDFSGRAWQVDGVYQLTPSGKRYGKYIKSQSFVVCG